MRTVSKFDEVEEVSIPRRYQIPAERHTYHDLCIVYEDLKKEHYQALQHIEIANRESWSVERLCESLNNLLEAQKIELARLAEAGRYAVYGKPPPVVEEELSPVVDMVDGEYDSGAAKNI